MAKYRNIVTGNILRTENAEAIALLKKSENYVPVPEKKEAKAKSKANLCFFRIFHHRIELAADVPCRFLHIHQRLLQFFRNLHNSSFPLSSARVRYSAAFP